MTQITHTDFDVDAAVEPYLTDEYYFDEEAAFHPVGFLESYCRITKDGALFNKGDLMKLLPWQLEVLLPVFGIKRKEDDRRRFQYVWVEIPKKQGKSGLLSGLSIYLTGPGGESGGEIYGAANQRSQAGLILDDAKEMIRLDPYLTRSYEIRQYQINYPKTNSVYKVVSAESSGIHGANLSGVFYDEIHAGSVDHQVKDLWDALRKSVVTRENPLIFVITNSGVVGSYPHHLHQYAKKVEHGLIEDDRWFVKTYNLPDEDDIYKEESFAKVNPAYGTLIPKRYWQDVIKEIENDPLSESVNRRLHFGQWVKTTESWSIANIWSRGFEAKKSIKDFAGHECFVGLDLADSRDLSSVSIVIPPVFKSESGTPLLFKDNKNERFEWFTISWCPSETVDRRLKDESLHFKEWIKAGYVRVTSGNFRDSEVIASDVIEMVEGLKVIEVGFDRAKSDVVVPRLMEAGLECVPWPQTPYAMDGAVGFMDELITNSEVNHQGNPLLEYQIGNVELYHDRELNKWVHKSKSKQKGTIDSIVSFLNAVKSYLEHIKEPPSDFEDIGID